ncbi:MAG: DNA invertase Pin-like site-specific DNA recombinase [Paracoccaceae bacterium]|jgi:DNA invertase Pin-like site-specific DNA recombinase
MASVLLGLGEIELTNIRERQTAGIAGAKKKGVYEGRSPELSKPIRRDLANFDHKASSSEIASALGVSTSTVNWLCQVASR